MKDFNWKQALGTVLIAILVSLGFNLTTQELTDQSVPVQEVDVGTADAQLPDLTEEVSPQEQVVPIDDPCLDPLNQECLDHQPEPQN